MGTSNGVVHEALTKGNYGNWSILAKNYLISEDLWDVIDDKEGVAEKAAESRSPYWKKKNAKALHIIQMSCGSEFLPKIGNSETAKSAWNTLAALCNVVRVSGGKADIEQVVAGDVEAVRKLAKQAPKRLLEERDANGYTALALVADTTDDIDMAICMVDRSEALLGLQTNQNFIPVELAVIKRHKKMTGYLYNKTPRSILSDSSTSASLLTRCIISEIFDVALELLQRNPRLPLNQKLDDVSPIYALAQKPSVFPSASPLKFWLWLYNCLTHDKEGKAMEIRLSINQGDPRRHTTKGVQHKLWGKILTLSPFKHPWKIFLAFTGYLYKLWEKVLTLGPIKYLWKAFLGFPGIKGIYDRKMIHFQVVEILRSMAKGILDFDDSQLRDALVYDSLLEASKRGIVEFINLMTEANPDLYWVVDGNHRGIFSHAVLHRQEKIFNLVYQLGGQGLAIMSKTDEFNNNMLHFTAMLAPISVLDRKSSPALQMQREIQWFEAVKEILHPKFQQATNNDGKKPQELFAEKHEQLVKEGVQWAKDTANTFTVVSTLLITIMFAAAFTVPGGNNDNGIPVFLNERMFTVFMVADALSLFASTTSVMVFIVILTSRYAAKDFLKFLPKMLMFGVFSLICAVLTMMLAFCAAFSLMLRGHFQIVIVAISVASVSIIVFLMFQLPLLFKIYNSTYRSPIFVNKNMT